MGSRIEFDSENRITVRNAFVSKMPNDHMNESVRRWFERNPYYMISLSKYMYYKLKKHGVPVKKANNGIIGTIYWMHVTPSSVLRCDMPLEEEFIQRDDIDLGLFIYRFGDHAKLYFNRRDIRPRS